MKESLQQYSRTRFCVLQLSWVADIKPMPRRAHAGVIFTVDETPTIVIYGGRTKSGELLSDVWAASLDNPNHIQWVLKRDIPDELEEDENGEEEENDDEEESSSNDGLTKKHHRKSKKNYPARRKGHVAISIPDNPHQPLMVKFSLFFSLPFISSFSRISDLRFGFSTLCTALYH